MASIDNTSHFTIGNSRGFDTLKYVFIIFEWYTSIGHKLGFGPTRKLPRFNDRKRFCIVNTEPFAIVESRGFGAVQIPSLWPILVCRLLFLIFPVLAISQNSVVALTGTAVVFPIDAGQRGGQIINTFKRIINDGNFFFERAPPRNYSFQILTRHYYFLGPQSHKRFYSA